MASFSTIVKEELTKLETSKVEKISLLAAFIRNIGKFDNGKIEIHTESPSTARMIYSYIKELYLITPVITLRKGLAFNKKTLYILTIKQNVNLILSDLSIIDNNGEYLSTPHEYVVADFEEKKAYIRGSFLASGSINDPKLSRYHLEFLVKSEDNASFLSDLLNQFDLNSKVIHRNNGYMVYIKEAEKIGDIIRIIGCQSAVLYYEDIRIYRDHKNMTNRLNNMEQANVDKVIVTALNQIKEIELIEKHASLDLLDEKTKEAANFRIKYPESSLQELSEIITFETGKTISKSGLNHRFRKIKDLAEKLN